MKRICRYLPFALLFFCAPLLRAQGSFDVAMGFGTERAKATGTGIDPTTFDACMVSTDTACELTPALGRLFMGFEGDAMLNKHIGFGGELNFHPTKGDYGPLEYRQLFYDFNGLYAPINHKKVQLRIEGGVGGAHTGFSYSATSCVGVAVCTTQVVPVGSASHFQVHVGAGLQIYVKGHLFVRPQFDFRQVPGLTGTFSTSATPTQVYQFGTNHVLGGTVWVGYNFGEM